MNWHLEEMYLWRRLNVQTIGGVGLKMEKSEENMSCKMKKNFANWS